MKEHIETVRAAMSESIPDDAPGGCDCSGCRRVRSALAALAKIEAEHERVAQERQDLEKALCDAWGVGRQLEQKCDALRAQLTDCQLESIPSRRHSDASWQRQNDALRARVEQLKAALRRIAGEPCKFDWKIAGQPVCAGDAEILTRSHQRGCSKCIARTALAAPEQKEPAQPEPDCYCDVPSEYIGACPRHQFIQEPAQPPLPTLAEVRALLNELHLEMNGAELYLRECDGDSGIADWARKTTDSIAALLSRIPEGE